MWPKFTTRKSASSLAGWKGLFDGCWHVAFGGGAVLKFAFATLTAFVGVIFANLETLPPMV